MVVGESGLGKSTLINSLFLTDLYVATMYEEPYSMDDKDLYENTTPTTQTLTINEATFQLQEGDVALSLRIIDTPGFGDDVDNRDSWNSIVRTVEQKLKDHLNTESRVVRKSCEPDNRVHCCLYFVSPNSHRLKPLDIEFMKRLHNKVNVVPIIGKADTLTSEECAALKEKILEQIEKNDINIYSFPQLTNETSEERDDEDYVSRIPFAVVGSTMLFNVGNEKVVRGRKYPWGVVDADNLEHCDFVALRSLLLCSHTQDLIEVTNDIHYENFRSSALLEATSENDVTVKPERQEVESVSPMEKMDKEREEKEKKLKSMQLEMEQVFKIKVEEKKNRLVNTEKDFQRKYDITMENMKMIREDIEERRRILHQEQSEWNMLHTATGKKIKKHKK